jgi:hypothetical protein
MTATHSRLHSLVEAVQAERARIDGIVQWLRDNQALSANCEFELLGAVTVHADGRWHEAGWNPEQQPTVG